MELMRHDGWQDKYLSDDARQHPISFAVARAIERCAYLAVLGYGISNRPLVDILLALGARVVVYDQKSAAELGEDAQAAVDAGALFVSEHVDWLALHPAVLFRSPGIRPDEEHIARACAGGACLGSEMAWLLERTPARVLALTGSDGKTTSTTLTARILQAQCAADGCGRVFLGGNLGTPLLSRLPDMCAEDFVVVELSSFQLATPMRHPARAAITNVTPNHLNWHIDMQEYIDAKRNICHAQQGTVLVTNAQNEITRQLAAEYDAAGGDVVLFAQERTAFPTWAKDTICCEDGAIVYRAADGTRTDILPTSELLLPGRHNIENFMTACALTRPYATPVVMAEVGRTFGGVEHRLERVRVLDGVTFYNSSIDSSPTRTAAALSALPARSCVVICGGYDKHIPFAPLADVLCERAGAVVLTGATRESILQALREHPDFETIASRVRVCPDFTQAVDCAAALAAAGYGENVLLSPACASFDAFVNFEERGRVFKELVMQMEALPQERNQDEKETNI